MRTRIGTILIAVVALVVGAAAGLYEQLEFCGISDADAQNIIYRAAYLASFSYECLDGAKLADIRQSLQEHGCG